MARLVAHTGHGIDLAFGENLVGTGSGIQVSVLPELGLDPRHYCIRVASDGCEIVDVRSSSGTFVNGEKVSGIVALKHGDLIEAGKLSLKLEDESTAFEGASASVESRLVVEDSGPEAGVVYDSGQEGEEAARLAAGSFPAGKEDGRGDENGGSSRRWIAPAIGILLVGGIAAALWAGGIFEARPGPEDDSGVDAPTLVSHSGRDPLSLPAAEPEPEPNPGQKAMEDAQLIASMFTSARAAGSEEVMRVGNLDQAVRLVLGGVRGGGSFSDRVFKLEGLTRESTEKAMEYLSWDDGEKSIQFHEEGAPSTAVSVLNQAREAKDRRNAQNIVSVHSAAMAAGAAPLPEEASLEEVMSRLTKEPGIKGSGPFETTVFIIPQLGEEDVRGALNYIERRDGLLAYRQEPKEEIPAEPVVEIVPPEFGDGPSHDKTEANRPGIVRAEALNIALSSFAMANGRVAAIALWLNCRDDEERFALLSPFIEGNPASLGEYFPEGFRVELWADIAEPSKVALFAGEKQLRY